MHRRVLQLLALTAVIAVGHLAATFLFLYWTTEWADIVMHFLGGAWVALLSVVIGRWFGVRVPFWRGLLAVLIVGLAWEAFELAVRVTSLQEYPDALLDLVMDILGGIFVFNGIAKSKHAA